MASEPEDRGKNLSAEEQLRAADRELAQLRDVLASMDEIDALRKREGKPETCEYGGYRRADVTAMVAELEARRRELLSEISRGGGPESAADCAAVRERVTLSDALERLYAAVSGNIERAKTEVLQELKYSCRQDTAIYAQLSARIDAIADKVAQKVLAAGIDYDALARCILANMTNRDDKATIAAMEKRIEELEAALAAKGKEPSAAAETTVFTSDIEPCGDASDALFHAQTVESETVVEGEAPLAEDLRSEANFAAERESAEEGAAECDALSASCEAAAEELVAENASNEADTREEFSADAGAKDSEQEPMPAVDEGVSSVADGAANDEVFAGEEGEPAEEPSPSDLSDANANEADGAEKAPAQACAADNAAFKQEEYADKPEAGENECAAADEASEK